MAHPEFRGFRTFRLFGDLGELSRSSLVSIWVSHFVGTISISLLIFIFMYRPAIACIMVASFFYLCHAYDMLASLSYTMRGRPFVVVGLWVTSMLPLAITQTVSYMFLFNTCISLANWLVIIYYLACHYLARPFLLCHDLTWLLSILWYAWLFIKYHHSVMLSLNTQHDNLTCDYHLYGNFTLLSCIMISDLYSCFICSDLTI